jgi:hypothetical protein
MHSIENTSSATPRTASKPDRDVAVHDFLEHLDVGHQSPALGDAPLEDPLCIDLVWVWCAHQVHRDVRIDQDHGNEPYPDAISSSIRSTSAVGNE